MVCIIQLVVMATTMMSLIAQDVCSIVTSFQFQSACCNCYTLMIISFTVIFFVWPFKSQRTTRNFVTMLCLGIGEGLMMSMYSVEMKARHDCAQVCNNTIILIMGKPSSIPQPRPQAKIFRVHVTRRKDRSAKNLVKHTNVLYSRTITNRLQSRHVPRHVHNERTVLDLGQNHRKPVQSLLLGINISQVVVKEQVSWLVGKTERNTVARS